VPGDDRFERVVQAHGPALRRIAAAWEPDTVAREDLFQEMLIALWRALPRFRGDASERTFVLRVAMNRALSHRFRRPPRAEPLDMAAHVADPAKTPEAEASASQERARLLSAVQSLPLKLRQVITLSLEGLAGGEIADVLGIRENNVHVRLSRARRALQEALHTL
jgi:RNA polymerase sigma factor (sigma-70 family)